MVVAYVVLIMEVLTTVLVKAAVFWHVRPCGLVDSYYVMENLLQLSDQKMEAG